GRNGRNNREGQGKPIQEALEKFTLARLREGPMKGVLSCDLLGKLPSNHGRSPRTRTAAHGKSSEIPVTSPLNKPVTYTWGRSRPFGCFMLRLNRALWAQSASSEAPAAYLVLAFRYSQTAGETENDPFRRWPRERRTMYIYGSSQIHAAQPINA